MRQTETEAETQRERWGGGRERDWGGGGGGEGGGQRERELFSESQTVHSQLIMTTPLHTNKQVTDAHSPTA